MPNGVVSICRVRLGAQRRARMRRRFDDRQPTCGREARALVWHVERWLPVCAYHRKFYAGLPTIELAWPAVS